MSQLRKTPVRLGAAFGALLWPFAAFAQDIPPVFGTNSLINETCQGAGFNCTARDETYFAEALGSVVFGLLSFTGVVFTALILYGGYRWMLARGNEQEVERGKAIIRSAIIGLVITLASYSIWLTISYFI